MNVEALERQEIEKKQRLVGALFLLALVLAMIFAYWMGAFGIGGAKSVTVMYDFAGGIERGSTVRLAGVKVGRVSGLDFVSDQGTQLKLQLDLTRSAYNQITDDTKFFINLAGLIGERYIEVVPGTGSKAPAGHVFRGIDPPRIDQLISQGYGIFGDLRSFFQENKGDLKEIFASLNELSGNLAKIMSSVSPAQRKQISDLIANLSAMSIDLRDLASNLNGASNFIESNGGRDSWTRLSSILKKGDSFDVQDIRRLILEDGVKVNFSTKRVPSVEDLKAEANK
jgi:phospholipid/cholesterol/gamma-HCH transport system substrate-binding protein